MEQVIALSSSEVRFVSRIAYETSAAASRARGVPMRPYAEFDDHQRELLEDSVRAKVATGLVGELDVFETAIDSYLKARADTLAGGSSVIEEDVLGGDGEPAKKRGKKSIAPPPEGDPS